VGRRAQNSPDHARRGSHGPIFRPSGNGDGGKVDQIPGRRESGRLGDRRIDPHRRALAQQIAGEPVQRLVRPVADIIVIAAEKGDAEVRHVHLGSDRHIGGRRQSERLTPPGESKQAWRIFSEIGLRKRPATPLFNPREIMDLIADAYPSFKGVDYDDLPAEGFVLP